MPANASQRSRGIAAIAAVVLTALVAGLVLIDRPLHGPRAAGAGTAYFYSDGFVARDTSRTPNEFYVAQLAPELISKVTIDTDGLVIRLKDVDPDSGLPANAISAARPSPGTVSVLHRVSGDYAWKPNSDVTSVHLMTAIEEADWAASVSDVVGQ